MVHMHPNTSAITVLPSLQGPLCFIITACEAKFIPHESLRIPLIFQKAHSHISTVEAVPVSAWADCRQYQCLSQNTTGSAESTIVVRPGLFSPANPVQREARGVTVAGPPMRMEWQDHYHRETFSGNRVRCLNWGDAL